MKLFRNSNLRSAAGIFNIQDVSTQTNHFFNSRGLASSVVDASHLANTPGGMVFPNVAPKQQTDVSFLLLVSLMVSASFGSPAFGHL